MTAFKFDRVQYESTIVLKGFRITSQHYRIEGFKGGGASQVINDFQEMPRY